MWHSFEESDTSRSGLVIWHSLEGGDATIEFPLYLAIEGLEIVILAVLDDIIS